MEYVCISLCTIWKMSVFLFVLYETCLYISLYYMEHVCISVCTIWNMSVFIFVLYWTCLFFLSTILNMSVFLSVLYGTCLYFSMCYMEHVCISFCTIWNMYVYLSVLYETCMYFSLYYMKHDSNMMGLPVMLYWIRRLHEINYFNVNSTFIGEDNLAWLNRVKSSFADLQSTPLQDDKYIKRQVRLSCQLSWDVLPFGAVSIHIFYHHQTCNSISSLFQYNGRNLVPLYG